MNKAEKHMEICKRLNSIYIKKNHDYGDSFSDTYHKLGIISCITRITDKNNRLIGLCSKDKSEQKVLDESIIDTLLDAANYCIMTAIELEENDCVGKGI